MKRIMAKPAAGLRGPGQHGLHQIEPMLGSEFGLSLDAKIFVTRIDTMRRSRVSSIVNVGGAVGAGDAISDTV
jgi:hypothetical protein